MDGLSDPSIWPPEARPASVLIPLFRAGEGEAAPAWHILFTRRTETVADHKGQVSFPGGQAHPEDPTPETTALREAYEEIGLKPEDVRLAGKLERVLTTSKYLVTPVVGFIPWPYSFQLQPEEVSRVFSIPLAWLADPKHYEIHEHKSLQSSFEAIFRSVIYFQPYDGEILWGVSADITLRFLRHLGIA